MSNLRDQLAHCYDSGEVYAYAFGVVRGLLLALQDGVFEQGHVLARFVELQDLVDARIRALEFQAASAVDTLQAARHERQAPVTPAVDQPLPIYSAAADLGDAGDGAGPA